MALTTERQLSFPTSALAAIEFRRGWTAVSPGAGQLAELLDPERRRGDPLAVGLRPVARGRGPPGRPRPRPPRHPGRCRADSRITSRYGTLTEASAASRTTARALNAIPRPAAAIMSRSLAPSPTATVWLSGMPASAAKRRSASAFPARSMTGPASPPGQLAIGDLQRVSGHVVDAQLGRERVGELGEAAADDPAPVAEPLERPDQRARAGSQPQLGADRVERPPRPARPAARPAPAATRRSRAHRASRPRSARSPASAQPARAASRSMTSPPISVESTSITISRIARRCRPPRCTATSARWFGTRGPGRPAARPGRPRIPRVRCRLPGGARAGRSGRCWRRWPRSARRWRRWRPGASGSPSTVTCSWPRRRAGSPEPVVISASRPRSAATAPSGGESRSGPDRRAQPSRAPSTSRPRITTCSMSMHGQLVRGQRAEQP